MSVDHPAGGRARRVRAWRVRCVLAALSAATLIGAAACTGGDPPGKTDPSASVGVPPIVDPAGQLAARAAAARDRTYTAAYSYTPTGKASRTVTVTVAPDGTWRVDVPGGALGGTADVSLVRSGDGLYQCPAKPSPTCVRFGPATGAIPASIDPRVEHLFIDWLGVFTDRQQAISVAAARNLPGAAGTCFSVEPSAASLSAPLDAGIFCYDTDGTLTAAAVSWGTVQLVAAPSPAPPTVTLPGPIVAGSPLPTASPPPSPSASASATAR